MNKNYEFALTAVLNDIGLNRSDARMVNIDKQDGLYYVSFRTDCRSMKPTWTHRLSRCWA